MIVDLACDLAKILFSLLSGKTILYGYLIFQNGFFDNISLTIVLRISFNQTYGVFRIAHYVKIVDVNFWLLEFPLEGHTLMPGCLLLVLNSMHNSILDLLSSQL
jgi:hypothetical protein